ncbi:MAG: hypothetical protein S4CHLAM123_06500 [Chlamydiales bacterium]|nr:hypothetical protein [Chlamydiales bacterium]
MKPRDRKLEILQKLAQEAEPITLSNLLTKLQSRYADRTVRRWINQLIEEELVKKVGHTKNAKYLAVDSKKNNVAEISSCFSSESLDAIAQINLPLYTRNPVAYNEQWLGAYIPNKSYYLSPAIREKLLLSGQRASKQEPAGTYAHQIFNRLLIDLSYNSSRLEGNTYSLLDTERLLLYGDSAEGKLDGEKIMILNHKEAIRYIVDNASTIQIKKETICTLHYLLSDGLVDAKYAGKIRDHGVRIGGSTYIPYENPNILEKKLQQIVNKTSQIENPFEQSLFLLIHISYLQAFTDVNKRAARLSANIPLITQNLVPLSFNNIDTNAYLSSLLALYELQAITPLIDLYIYSYMRTCSAYDSTIQAMGFDEIRVRYRRQRRDLIREIIQSKLVGSQLNLYVKQAIQKEAIPIRDKESFLTNLFEDLDLMDESRLGGLGVTPEQLHSWQKLRTN